MEGMDPMHPPSTPPRFDTRVLTPSAEGVAKAAQALLAGAVVGIPTETVYGLAGHAFQAEALARIFEAKGRPTRDPLILHVPVPEAGVSTGWPEGTAAHLCAMGVVAEAALTPAMRTAVDRLAERFWPGPLTLILPRGDRVPTLATSGLDTVAVRAPAHPVAQALLRQVQVPLAAPSANRFGRISPTTAAHVLDELGGRIGLILDGGPAHVGVESTVVRVMPDGSLSCLRPGGIPQEALDAVMGSATAAGAAQDLGGALVSPGMMESHYAPARTLHLLPAPIRALSDDALRSALAEAQEGKADGGGGLLLQEGADAADAQARIERMLSAQPSPSTLTHWIVLAPEGGADAAARNLFGSLRALDQNPEVGWILAEPPPHEGGLWDAIRDRLRRAAAPRSHEGSTPG
jgi:L-threonylcarbamoyladenylate synthase